VFAHACQQPVQVGLLVVDEDGDLTIEHNPGFVLAGMAVHRWRRALRRGGTRAYLPARSRVGRSVSAW
jgi:hypothetical protein